MASKRNVSKKKPQFGNNRSHSMKATRRQFKPNLQWANIYVPELGRTVRIKISARELRTIDKIGLKSFLEQRGESLNKVKNL